MWQRTFLDLLQILWNEEEGIWFDYDALNKKQRKYFYASNFAPLWSRSYRKDPDIIGDLAVKYLSKSGVIDGKGNPIFWGKSSKSSLVIFWGKSSIHYEYLYNLNKQSDAS